MKNRRKGMILSYVNTALTMLFGIFLSSFYVKQLGSTEYGIYSTIGSFINYLVLLEFGTGTAMTRNLSLCISKKKSKDEIQKNVSTIWSITIFLSIVIILVSILFYFLIDRIYVNTMTISQIEYAKRIFLILLLYLIFSFFSQTMYGIVLAYENYTYSSKISIIKTLTKTILVILLIVVDKQSIYIAIVDMILSFAICIYTFNYCKGRYKISFSFSDFDKKILKSTLPLCFALFLQVVVNQANSNVDKFLIGIMISPEMVTMYSISLYIYSLFSASTTIPISLYAPQVIREVGKGSYGKELIDKLIQPSRYIVIIGGLILFGFISVGKQFICILYGTNYLESWSIAIIILIPAFINMSNGLLINVLDALNKRIVRSLALLLTTVLNIIMTVIFIKRWGPIGAAIATLICTFLGQILIMNIYYYKKMQLPILYMFKEIYKGIIWPQVIAMCISYLVTTCISNMYLSLLMGGMTFLIIFVILFLMFGKNEIEKKYFELIKQRLIKNIKFKKE